MTMTEPVFTDPPRDRTYLTMQRATELYVRDGGETLIVIDIDEYLRDDDDIARIRAHATSLSQRDGISVRLDSRYEEKIEVFEAGRLAHKLERVFYEAVRYRHESWLAGAQDPWRVWEVGSEPVTRYVPPQLRTCSCAAREEHTEIAF